MTPLNIATSTEEGFRVEALQSSLFVEPGRERETPMETLLTKIIEELQRRAKVCETAANDSAEEALTGESCEKEKNAQLARDWMIRSKVWLEAENAVREMIETPTLAERQPSTVVKPPEPCI